MKKTIILVMLLVCSVTQAQIALEIDSEGYYLISSAADLQEFAAFVNDGNQKINGRLTADIDLSGVANFTPIGLYRDNNSTHSGFNRQYQGTFDGGRHVISNLTVNTEEYYEAGLFSRIYKASIKDLGVVNATITTNNVDGRAGVFVGYNRNCTMTNCWSAGNIVLTSTSGVEAFGGIAGAAGVYKNCWTTYSGPIAATNNPSFSNCYSGAEAIAMAPTGELCYKLNEGAGETVYYQTLGTDAYPTLDDTHGVVYLAVDQNCDGTPKGEISYSNSASGTRDPHILADGICTVCGQLPQAADGYYEISTSAALVKFATMVNEVDQSINGRLTADIDLNDVPNFTPIGLYRDSQPKVDINYRGTFDGAKHVVRNLKIETDEYYEAGLFSRLYGGTVKNLGVANIRIRTNNEQCRAGGIAGFNRSGVIENCWTSGVFDIVCPDERPTNPQIGAIAGGSSSGTYSDCWSSFEAPIANGSGSSSNWIGYDNYPEIAEDAKSGALCWFMNNNSFINPKWYQTVGQDDYPTWNNEKGIIYKVLDGFASLNPEDEVSFGEFIANMIIMEKESFNDKTVAYQALLNEYDARVDSWADIMTFKDFCAEYVASQSLKDKVMASIALYAQYIEACEFAIQYLKENDFKSELRTFLENYLEKSAAPSDDYPNGTYLYVVEEHVLNDAQIKAETANVNDLLQRVIATNILPGTEITVTLANHDFKKGLEGWKVEATNDGVTSGGEPSLMSVAYGLNTNFSVEQTLTDVPNGIYMLRINAFTRVDDDIYDPLHVGQLFLNGNSNFVKSISEGLLEKDDAEDGVNCLLTGSQADTEFIYEDKEGYVPSSVNGCSYAFRANRYMNYTAVEVTDSTITLGVRNLGSGLANDWLPFGDVHVYYLGNAEQANEKLTEVLSDYTVRATAILDFPFSQSTDYAKYPNMSEALKGDIAESVEAVSTAMTGEQKMALVNRFSELFNMVYDCRKAYIALMQIADELIDKAVMMHDTGLLDDDGYDAALETGYIALDKYAAGNISAEEAWASVEEMRRICENIGILQQDEDGYYLIKNAQNLVTFSHIVNNGERNANARLTSDIDMSGIENFPPIGQYINASDVAELGVSVLEVNRSYQGTFDGQGHTVSNVKISVDDYEEAGFFSRIWSATVKNLGLVNITVNNLTATRTGAFAGFMYKSTVTNCFTAGDIVLESGYAHPGSFSSSANQTTLTNCWSNYEGVFSPENNGTQVNCHKYESNPNIVADAKSGALCYKLNEGAGETVYYQTLGTDDYPTFDATHGVVYLAVDQKCDGTPKGEISYSNSSDGSRDPHTLVDGICSVCGQLPQAADGYYEISTSAALVKFAAMVNAGDQTINGRLTADIDLSDVSNFTPIGLYRDNNSTHSGFNRQYQGTFDGGRHVISNLTVNTEEYYEAGLFSRIYKASIKDLGVVNATITTNNVDGRAGVFVGYNRNCTMTNCWSAGNIVLTSTSGVEAFGGIAAAAGVYKNCWTTYNGPIAATNNPSFTNCYSGAEAIAMAPTGELCYKLNEGAGETVYYQTIGSDAYPVFDSLHGEVILNADGTYGNTTDITNVKTTPAVEGIFDLSGRRVANGKSVNVKLAKGLYIINGKKVLVK